MKTPTPPIAEEEIFQVAVALPPHERAAYLDVACGDDLVLRARIERLLGSHDEISFMQAPASPQNPEIEAELARLKPEEGGEMIGPYKLREQIGEGGFGTVWVADQELPVRRRVALKIIKLGMDTKEVIARFGQERQALAMMDHPNIAKVLDAGATQYGRPYFVMELVRGVKITDYCDDQQLSTAERIELFIIVCQAVQHAHQKGIIHRDLKPSNILVTINDGEAVPKVIDFGVAKATQGRLTDQTVYTQFQQMIGTPLYMSPEQAEMTSLDIDTRSDIYALGVLLYELLTGHTPIEQDTLARMGLDEIRRIIREVDPPRPSLRVKTLDGAEMTTAAKRRHTEPAKLSGTLRGDLDWIVMKCLEKDRKRRYDSASVLALDLRRHLANEIVTARPPTPAYLLGKLIRRHKLPFAVATATALALLLGAVASTLQAVRARKAETEAMHARDLAEAINQFLIDDLLAQATPDQNAREKKVTMEEVLDRAARKLDQNADIARKPELEATLRLGIGTTYHKLDVPEQADRNLRRAVALRQKTLGPQHKDTLLAQLQLISALTSANSYTDESEALARETARDLKILAGDTTRRVADPALYRAALDAEAGYAFILANRNQMEKAIALQRKNLEDYERAFGSDDADILNERGNLARMLAIHGDYAEAAAVTEETLARYQQISRSNDPSAIVSAANLGLYRFFLDEPQDAERILSELLPRSEHWLGKAAPTTLGIQLRLARALDDQGNSSRAVELAAQTLDGQRSALTPNDGNIAICLLVLGRAEVKNGKLAQAEQHLGEALEIFEKHYASKPHFTAAAQNWLGAIRLAGPDRTNIGSYFVPGAEQFFARTAELSLNERREAVNHVIEFYNASGDSGQTAQWKSRWAEFEKRFTNEKARQRAPR